MRRIEGWMAPADPRAADWMKRVGRLIAPALVAAAACTVAHVAQAQDKYPSKPVRIVVGFAPGGGSDIVARAISGPLGEALGQPVIVDNRPGGDAVIATEYAARAPADGYTVLQVTSTQVINMVLKDKDKIHYDLLRDFIPVGRTVGSPMVLVVPASSPIQSVADLVALGKTKPGGLNYGSGSTGSVGHLASELFKRSAGIHAVTVTYKGNGPMLPDLISGRIDFAFLTHPDSIPAVSGGQLRALAVAAPTRVATMPGVPTMVESGYRDVIATNMYGYLLPAGTPDAVVKVLQQAIAKAAAAPSVQERLPSLGLTPIPGGPDDLVATMKDELERWGQIIRTAHIRPE